MKVLLIEDDIWQADLVKDRLTKEGMEVAVVRDAIAGIEQVDSAMPTVIVLDIFLPGPNGLAFLHELRSFSDTGDIPVIIWTTATMKACWKLCRRLIAIYLHMHRALKS